LAKLGDTAEAVAVSERVIAAFTALGIRGLNLGRAHQIRARVALEADDQVTFDVHAAIAGLHRSAAPLRRSTYPQIPKHVGSGEFLGVVGEDTSVLSQLTSVLQNCRTSGERARCGLELMARSSGAVGGFLYGLTASGPACCAALGRAIPDDKVEGL